MPYYTNLLGMGAPVPNTYSPFRMSTAQPRGLFSPVGAGPPIRRATLPGPWTPPAFPVPPDTPPPGDDQSGSGSYEDEDDGYPANEPPYGSSDGSTGFSDGSTGFSSTAGGSYSGGYDGGYGGQHSGTAIGGTDYSFGDHEAVDGTGHGTNDQRASDYADAVDAMNKAAQKRGEATFGGLLSDPMGTLNKYGSDPATIPSLFMSMAGFPFGRSMLNAIGNYNLKAQAYDRAHTAMGTDGYSYGTIDGNPYSIGINALGHRAITGNVPDWFTVDAADRMSTASTGYDPTTGDALTGFGRGRGGFTATGDFVDQYGNVHAFGDWSDLEALADERGLTTSQVSEALGTARNTGDLEAALDIVSDRDEYGLGDDYGTVSNPDVATVEGVVGVTMDSDEFLHDPNGDDDEADPNTDFSDEMDEEHSPW